MKKIRCDVKATQTVKEHGDGRIKIEHGVAWVAWVAWGGMGWCGVAWGGRMWLS